MSFDHVWEIAWRVVDRHYPSPQHFAPMPLFNFPDPVSIVESAKTAGLERAAANAACSAAYSFSITLVWRLGDSRAAAWLGAGPALKSAATAMYLSLRELEEKKFLALTIPQDLLNADNLSKFQTEKKA